MKPDEHVAKAARITRSMSKCRPDDYELIIEGAMLATNHYVNAALHKLGIRPPDVDIIHTDYLRVSEYRRLEILADDLLHTIEQIEELRAPYVRGCAAGGKKAARQARTLLDRAHLEFEAVEPNTLPMQDYLPSD